ncbi:hypothetical protein SAMN05421819_0863 [Bryocella elongata]|uniref:Spermatogenesis-associated protein 20-like TRX domain-containing protein n=1 Tax=Bryocella elongata TaxID=863522 RepID=A0A1H5U6E8_9BACT|nr:thioredoxin domain-containing protein [Bryocella elongata]SEF69891.1 hypothetical protein SAMN05421819_0863 [Bryocella elongata]
MSHEHSLNALANSASAYLRSARHQPVNWHEWGAEAFERAQRENKPVLLDIGAVWCHWCHVMDRESYEDPQMAAMINDLFVAVKVDRDERPDVDVRYQSAVSAISGQGGWPLTAFLTPDGKPFFGGTYFPPDNRYGRPGFGSVLRSIAGAYAERRTEVEETAASVMNAIEHNESFSAFAKDPGTPLLEKLIGAALTSYDPRNGGFGSQPKFPHSGAIDLLLDEATRGTALSDKSREVALTTLKRMARGGIYDQLAGGFHRYSVDERWIVPHFEKMAYDNSELLKNYAHAFASTADPEFAAVAKDIIRWMDGWLSDRVHGGFYASQDADDSLDDDGDYFTWTRDEAAAALTPEELEVAAAYFNIRVVGDMHHNPSKNVLHVPADIAVVANTLGRSGEEAQALLEAAQGKMYAARLQRRTPYVDKTIYTGWNGMCISAYLIAGRTLRLAEPVAFALKSLDRVLDAAWDPELGLARVVAYGEGGTTVRIDAVLDDYAFLAAAALDAWEATAEIRYYLAAKGLADQMVKRFYDTEGGGGFFDAETKPGALGALSAQRKPLQDSPTPAGNSTAAMVLLRLSALADDPQYEKLARETLEAFGGMVEHFGLYSASYGLALRRAISGSVQVCVVGDDSAAADMQLAATARFMVNKSVISVRRDQLRTLPPALLQTLPNLPHEQGGVALICRGSSCLPPVSSGEEVINALTE